MAIDANVSGEKKRQYAYEPALIKALNRFYDDPVLKQYAPELYQKGVELKKATIKWGRKFRSAYMNKNVDSRLGKLVADIANSPAIFTIRLVERESVLGKIYEFFKQHENSPEEIGMTHDDLKDALNDYHTLLGYAADTAYITPVVNDNKEIRFMIAVGKSLIEEMEQKHNNDEAKVDKAIIGGAVPHEFQHYQRGDIKPWLNDMRVQKYKNLTHDHFNILQDAMINGPLLRNFRADASALLDHVGVRGSTVKHFMKDAYIIQTAYDMRDEVKKNYNLNDEKDLKEVVDKFVKGYGDILTNELNMSEAHVKEALGSLTKDPNKLHMFVKDLFETMDKKLGDKTLEEFFSDLNSQFGKQLPSLIKSKALSPDTLSKITQPRDVPELISKNTERFEEKLDHTQIGDWWFKFYDRLLELYPKYGGAEGYRPGGPGGDGPVQPQDHKNPTKKGVPTIDVSEDEEREDSKRRQAAEEAFAQRHKHTIDSMSPFGQVEDELKLDYDPDIRFKNTIKAAIRTALELPEVAYNKRILPIINEPIRQGTATTMAGQNVQIGQPKGVLTRTPNEEPAPKIIFAVIDESGSHGREEIQKAMSAISDICKEENAVAIVAHMSADPTEAKFTAYDPKHTNRDEFLKTLTTGGTDGFHELIYNMDDLITKHKKFRKELDNSLAKYGVKGVGGKTLTADDVLKAYEKGSLAGLIITDGFIGGGTQPSKQELDKWLQYASNRPYPPVAIVSTTGHKEYPFSASADVLRKLFVYYTV